MQFIRSKIAFSLLLFFLMVSGSTEARKSDVVLERNVRANMDFLAGDALQGRGSGTGFERIAATYFASMMAQFGIEPAGQNDQAGAPSFIQTIEIDRITFAKNPTLKFGDRTLEHGGEMVVFRVNSAAARGPLQKLAADAKPSDGAMVFLKTDGRQPANDAFNVLMASGAAAIIVEETPQWRSNWTRFAVRKPGYTSINGKPNNGPALIIISKDAAAQIAALTDGTKVEFGGELAPATKQQTWNAVGKITGSDPKLSSDVVLLSAHLDHLGVRQNAQSPDNLYNGADDDASGCVAVIELARVLAAGKKPRRTVYFAFYGSEEAGGFGSRYFVGNLGFPKDKLVANLQFEMIGRPDPKVAADELWLTGYDRSNLGPELAKQGAKLVADPHPEQNFFQRSDNFTLAREGIVAHTVSSYGLHKDYHQASDEVSTIDFGHMTRAINSMVKPVRWLVNSSFKPAWNEGKRP